ncbi:unnamed protein product [Menidia menidia]|uniref:(Atlantic silverside) hypothetical protein n=1 Tax=Menidia menidia TaxID=238744 RepID=A0A8S4A7T3_9TELE|nr:unnamed protein product [Menidia menidia]
MKESDQTLKTKAEEESGEEREMWKNMQWVKKKNQRKRMAIQMGGFHKRCVAIEEKRKDTKTKQKRKVPTSVPPPTKVQSINGFSAQVSWASPTDDIRGLIDRYELKAYEKDHPEVPPIKAIYLANGNFTGVVTGLTPSTQYIVTVSACSPAGCAESLINDRGDNNLRSSLTTPEEVPDAVSTPSVVSSPSSLSVTWGPPARPNGGITEYLLYHNNRMVYRGKSQQHNITGLDVYSTHLLVLSACTSVGCTNSSRATALTSQLPPGPLQPPTLTLLDSRTIFVE